MAAPPYYDFTVAILALQGDTAISLCRERSLARRRALAFRRGALGRAAVERTSGEYHADISPESIKTIYL